MWLLNILPELQLDPQMLLKGKKIQNNITIPSLQLIKHHVLFKNIFFLTPKCFIFKTKGNGKTLVVILLWCNGNITVVIRVLNKNWAFFVRSASERH